MNILTFDIEEWYVERAYLGGHKERYDQYDKYLGAILDLLEEREIKATFFCVGGMATYFPNVVKKIASRGHEVGCHSYQHKWLNKMSQKDVYEDTLRAIDELEQCIGGKVKSYRAPAFSIGKDNKWAFEILAKCGIKRDASIFPAERDFGGFPNFGQSKPTWVFSDKTMIKEFPICTTKIRGRELAYSGGGYFRFFPLWFVKKEMHKTAYSMCYFHIGDLVPESTGLLNKSKFEEYFKIEGTLKNRILRYVKTNLGKKGAFSKMEKLIASEEFVNLEEADAMINWDDVSSVLL